MLNDFLEKHGFESVGEKMAGTLLLVVITLCALLASVIVVMLTVNFPLVVVGITLAIVGLYLYFKNAEDKE